MQACVLRAVGDLRYEEVPDPAPRPGEALIRVRACGVCGSDIPRIFSKGTYRFPTIPGHEFSGEVMAVGPDVDNGIIGKAVAVFPLVPCGNCAACEIGAFAQCEAYDYLGSRCDGAFAEFVRAPAWNLVHIPEGVSFEEAAMVEPAAVAVHALRRAGIDIGDSALIFGAGPIGLLVAMWAGIRGAGKVLLVDIDDSRLNFARRFGFDHVFNPARQGDVASWVRTLTGHGADLVVEASGSAAAFEQCVLSARTSGKVVLLGNPAGEMRLSQRAYWAILRNELTVYGTWNSSYGALPRDEWQLVLDFMASGQLAVTPLITRRLGLRELPNALLMLRDRAEFCCKMMCVVE